MDPHNKTLALRMAFLQRWCWDSCWDLSNLFIGNSSLKGIIGALAKIGGPTAEQLQQQQALIQTGTVYPTAGLAIAAAGDHPAVARLHLGSNRIGPAGAAAIEEALQANPKFCAQLVLLDLATDKFGSCVHMFRNSIADDGTERIASVLALQNCALRELVLSRNSIGPKGAKALAAALKSNKTLQILDLHHNSLGDEGTEALGEALATNKTLQKLVLSDNSIGHRGFASLASGLAQNKSLETLDVSWNPAGIQGAEAMAHALSSSKIGLIELRMEMVQISSRGCAALFAALKQNRTLERIFLNGNGIDDKAAPHIAVCLREPTSVLRHIDVPCNFFSSAGVTELHDGIVQNTTLTVLNLKHNPVEDRRTVDAISAILSRNIELRAQKLKQMQEQVASHETPRDTRDVSRTPSLTRSGGSSTASTTTPLKKSTHSNPGAAAGTPSSPVPVAMGTPVPASKSPVGFQSPPQRQASGLTVLTAAAKKSSSSSVLTPSPLAQSAIASSPRSTIFVQVTDPPGQSPPPTVTSPTVAVDPLQPTEKKELISPVDPWALASWSTPSSTPAKEDIPADPWALASWSSPSSTPLATGTETPKAEEEETVSTWRSRETRQSLALKEEKIKNTLAKSHSKSHHKTKRKVSDIFGPPSGPAPMPPVQKAPEIPRTQPPAMMPQVPGGFVDNGKLADLLEGSSSDDDFSSSSSED